MGKERNEKGALFKHKHDNVHVQHRTFSICLVATHMYVIDPQGGK